MSFIQKIRSHPGAKALVLRSIFPKGQARPRWWVRAFVNPFIHKRGRGSVVRRYARLDLVPFNNCSIGKATVVEDFCCLNNGLGDIQIGDNCTIGLGDILIAPVRIGNNVILAQHVVLSGLNHGYTDLDMPVRDQPCTTALITVEDDCWIGANTVIIAGVTIGKHSVIAGGSVVTRDVPPFSVAGGNPARILRQYNPTTNQWEKSNRT